MWLDCVCKKSEGSLREVIMRTKNQKEVSVKSLCLSEIKGSLCEEIVHRSNRNEAYIKR